MSAIDQQSDVGFRYCRCARVGKCIAVAKLKVTGEDDLEESGVVINSVDRMWGQINVPGEVKSSCRVAKLTRGKTVGKMMSMVQSKRPHLPITIDLDQRAA